MLSKKPGKKLNTYVPDYVVFDLETTGVSCVTDKVIEISALKVKNGQVMEEFSTLVNPECPIPFYASQVNGITDKMVKDSPVFQKAFADFLEFVGDAVLVGHNIHTFDMKFLYRDANRFWKQTVSNDYIDTLQLSRVCLPQLSHYKLTDLAEHYGISSEGAHRALCDCHMNHKVFERLGKEMKKTSVTTNQKNSVTEKSAKACPQCGGVLKKRSGRYGDFWGCTSFPGCRYTENV